MTKSLRHQMAAHELHAKVDSRENAKSALAASPAKLDYWQRKVDPDSTLPEYERLRRAEHARKAHFLRMAHASAAKRRRAS